MQDALRADATYTSRLLGIPAQAAPPSPRPTVDRDEVRARLLRLVQPRRPQRSPGVRAALSRSEVRDFDDALEQIAEGEYEDAVDTLRGLYDSNPDANLEAALAIGLLFADQTDEARERLARAMEAVRPTGNMLWNMACAEIRLGHLDEANQLLRACSTTEYRSSATLQQSLAILGGSPTAASPAASAPAPAAPRAPTSTGPSPARLRDSALVDTARQALQHLSEGDIDKALALLENTLDESAATLPEVPPDKVLQPRIVHRSRHDSIEKNEFEHAVRLYRCGSACSGTSGCGTRCPRCGGCSTSWSAA